MKKANLSYNDRLKWLQGNEGNFWNVEMFFISFGSNLHNVNFCFVKPHINTHELKLNKAVLYIHIHTHKIFLFTYTSDSHSVDIFSTEILPDWKEIIFYLGNEENLID